MIVVGLDTDTHGFHWSSSEPIPEGSDVDILSQMGYVAVGTSVEARRVSIYLMVLRLFRGLPANTHVFCEEPLALRNGKTTRLLSLAAGAIWAAFVKANSEQSDRSCFWYWADVAQWKKVVTGYGNSSKEDIKQFCLHDDKFRRFSSRAAGPGLPLYASMCESNPNLYDAWCLMEYGVGLTKEPE